MLLLGRSNDHYFIKPWSRPPTKWKGDRSLKRTCNQFPCGQPREALNAIVPLYLVWVNREHWLLATIRLWKLTFNEAELETLKAVLSVLFHALHPSNWRQHSSICHTERNQNIYKLVSLRGKQPRVLSRLQRCVNSNNNNANMFQWYGLIHYYLQMATMSTVELWNGLADKLSKATMDG